ncbi:MAG: enoyl-CoA hydratase/isomerase family protein [Candidatus Odinarchaeota archaeon]
MNNFEYIRLERKGKICICTLNRPEKKNALSEALRTEILNALDLFREDDRISTVIFYGGKEFFSTGFDKDEVQAAILNPEKTKRLKDTSLLFHKKFFEYPKLTIAAISGYALGGGFDLAVLCHLRVASKTAIFGHPEIGFGAVPLFFSYMSLMGRGKALELVLNTARKEDFINAEEAYHLNIINKLVEPENVLNEAINMAKQINKSPKLAVYSLIKVNNAFFDQFKAYENEVDVIVNNMTKK